MTDTGRPLTLADRARIEAHLQPLRARLGAEALSEFSFSNLWFFREVHAYRWIDDAALPCIAGTSYDGARHLMPLFDPAAVPDAALRARLGGHDSWFPLDATTAAALAARGWALSAQPDDADYLYRADNFRHYRGRVLRKKHNQLRQLLDRGPLEALPLGPAQVPAALGLLERWCRDKGQAGDAAACAAALADPLTLQGTLYRQRGAAIGFLLTEAYSASLEVVRFAKGLDEPVGTYAGMFHAHCCARPALQWLNFEQDLGRPNFRQAKRSYQPAALLSKCRASLTPVRGHAGTLPAPPPSIA